MSNQNNSNPPQLKIDQQSIYHLSFDQKHKILLGAALTKGSEGITTDGEKIKAGKIPVLFFTNSNTLNKSLDNRTARQNKKILKRVNGLHNNKSSVVNHSSYTQDQFNG